MTTIHWPLGAGERKREPFDDATMVWRAGTSTRLPARGITPSSLATNGVFFTPGYHAVWVGLFECNGSAMGTTPQPQGWQYPPLLFILSSHIHSSLHPLNISSLGSFSNQPAHSLSIFTQTSCSYTSPCSQTRLPTRTPFPRLLPLGSSTGPRPLYNPSRPTRRLDAAQRPVRPDRGVSEGRTAVISQRERRRRYSHSNPYRLACKPRRVFE